jgi:hypothetical protein
LTEEHDLKDADHQGECEYLIGDDTCSAVKEEQVNPLRTETCKNDTKEKCCYKCELREKCDIKCDLLEHRQEREEEPPSTAPDSNLGYSGKTECGACVFYLKRKCPRDYSSDQELWRRQEACEIFRPRKEH